MAIQPGNPSAPKGVPVGRPKRPLVRVRTSPEVEDDVRRISPWEWQGWGWSIAAHALLLLILGLWYFTPPPTGVKTFDTRLAGTELGSEYGMSSLGGLDTPLPPPELSSSPDTSITSLKASDITPDPMAGFTGKSDNPGAGQGDGFGLARFGNGGENIRGVAVKVGDPQFTLLWDSVADLDLHVFEPGGSEIYWNSRKGRLGGELDVDNVDGYGPENIYWLISSPDGVAAPGPGPPGEYRWHVHYYGGNRGVPTPTRWKVRIKHGGKTTIESGKLNKPFGRSQTYTLKVGPASSEDSSK
ncbi:YfaP family protein [Tundrisphaera sp. TA3]|uniref:YfaP family protein n=1 Tax=Tundrisphaera sp. TA3 TaxID=3435775 RepID=UPI003EBBE6CD